MLKRIYSIIVMLGVAFVANAQIMLTPYVDSSAGGLNENNVSVLEENLRTLISRAGLESAYGGRFILAANVNLLDKTMISTIPVKVRQRVQVTFAIGDSETGTCYGTTTTELTGLGDTDIQATLSCFRNLRLTPELNALIATSRDRIIQHYDANAASILEHAKSLVTGQKYDEALYELSFIPSKCRSYPEVAAYMTHIYQTNINHDAAQILAEAQAIWSADPNPGYGAEEAMRILAQINTDAQCYPQAQALMKKIEARVKNVTDAETAHERDMEKARLAAATSLEKTRIKACRDIAVAYAKSRPRVVYHVHSWW